ncbi:MAG: hypothetical protein AB7T49_05285 [Oligoflexales bacterium]
MGSFFPQAHVALKVYLERGAKIVALLEEHKIDEALELLRWRTAAFYNFKVADFMETKNGVDVCKDPALKSLWDEIRAVNTKLEKALKQASDEANKELVHAVAVKGALSKFRSGESFANTFRSSV